MRTRVLFRIAAITGALLPAAALMGVNRGGQGQSTGNDDTANNAVQLVGQGRQTFRFDTFGDQAFWGDMLILHQAIEGSGLGGVGPGVSPKAALAAGLKVDVDALAGEVNGDPMRILPFYSR